MGLLDRLLGRRRRLSEENKQKVDQLAQGVGGDLVWKLVELLLKSGVVQQAIVAIIEALLKQLIKTDSFTGHADTTRLEEFVNELEAKL